jgi:hypothetical protein
MAPITKEIWRDSLHTDTSLSIVLILIVALPSSKVAEGLMNCPAFTGFHFSLDSQQVVKERINV